jgi:hypothetical protein
MLTQLPYVILNHIIHNYLSDFGTLRGLCITSREYQRYSKGYTAKRRYFINTIMSSKTDIKFIDIIARGVDFISWYKSYPELYINRTKHCKIFNILTSDEQPEYIPDGTILLTIEAIYGSRYNFPEGYIPNTVEEIVYIGNVGRHVLPKSVKKMSFFEGCD